MTNDDLGDEVPEDMAKSEQIAKKNYSVCGAKKPPPQSSRGWSGTDSFSLAPFSPTDRIALFWICGDLRGIGFRAFYAHPTPGLVICHGVLLQVELS